MGQKRRFEAAPFMSDFEQGEVGPDLFRKVCEFGLEGLVSKRSNRPYRGGRSKDWIKVKTRFRSRQGSVRMSHETSALISIGFISSITPCQRGLVTSFHGEECFDATILRAPSPLASRNLRAD